VNGIRIHYVTQGEGPLIVLLHGFPEFWYSWRFQIPFLAERGYRVVAPDLRGYNDTEKPRAGYDIENLLCDIEGLIKGLAYERAILIGHDWGGVLAWAFAMRYSPMTEQLIVLNAPHPAAFLRELRTLKQMRKSWYVLAFQLPWLPEYLLGRRHARVIGRLLSSTAVQKSAFPPDVLERYREAMSKSGALRASLAYYRTLLRHSVRSVGWTQIPITIRTLLIWGEQDVALDPALTENLQAWVSNLQVKRIYDSGHWVQQEKPELVNRYLAEFLLG
jgi:pimeloyl-ACP methyl ester carboxylesterase